MLEEVRNATIIWSARYQQGLCALPHHTSMWTLLYLLVILSSKKRCCQRRPTSCLHREGPYRVSHVICLGAYKTSNLSRGSMAMCGTSNNYIAFTHSLFPIFCFGVSNPLTGTHHGNRQKGTPQKGCLPEFKAGLTRASRLP